MSATILPVEKDRLIVLVPECLVGNIELMNKIYFMATREERDVFYLVLVDDDADMLAATRSFATLKALISDGRLNSASRVVETSHWLAALRETVRPGDVIVCHAEQSVSRGFMRAVPASEAIGDLLNAPVRTISGFYHPEKVQIARWLGSLAYWLGPIAIIMAFFFLAVRLDQDAHGLARTVLLIVLMVTTVGAEVVWNNFSRQ